MGSIMSWAADQDREEESQRQAEAQKAVDEALSILAKVSGATEKMRQHFMREHVKNELYRMRSELEKKFGL